MSGSRCFRVSMLFLIATGVIIFTACSSEENDGDKTAVSPDAEFELPLDSEQQYLLDFRTSHGYLAFATDSTVGPGLFWRQFSDLYSHMGEYKPLVAKLYSISTDETCLLIDYRWRGADVERHYRCGQTEVAEVTAFVDANTVVTRFKITGARGALTIMGTVGENNANRSVLYLPSRNGFEIEISGIVANYWSDASEMKFNLAASSVPAAADYRQSQDTGSWFFDYHLSGNAEIMLTFSLDEPGVEPRQYKANEFAPLVENTANALDQWLAGAPDAEKIATDPTYAMSWYLFWANAAAPQGNWPNEAIVPSKRHYFRGIWLWDSAFHAIALAGGGPEAQALGRAQIDNFLQQPLDEGYLPREIWVESINPGIQPPAVMTWASLVLADKTGDESPLAGDYETLAANHRWYFDARDSDGDGLCEWDGTDSGWDTSPRWDSGRVEALDLNSWLYLDAMLLAEMARRLGHTDAQQQWLSEADSMLSRLRNDFWDEQDQLFYDLQIEDNLPLRVQSPATFMPLFVGAAYPEQASAVAQRLYDPDYFAGPYLLPTASPTSAAYEPNNYWRGPVWIVTNAFAVWGLQRYGLEDEASLVLEHTQRLVSGGFTPFEYYNSQTGQGIGAPNFMWSGAFYVMLLGEDPTVW
jgi:Mannosylglycerate hydrolase MGH1-like glycoside hydrolase domain